MNNYGADIGYAQCMRILRKRFDFVEYFLKMIEKYENIEKCKQKEMHLHVAFTYFNIKRDIREAIKYFLQAFEIETFEFNMEVCKIFKKYLLKLFIILNDIINKIN